MSGFHVHEVIKTLNGKTVSSEQWTTCSECGGKLESAKDWSRHRSMHTKISQHTLNCHIPQHILKGSP